jgi:hypothetical protein
VRSAERKRARWGTLLRHVAPEDALPVALTGGWPEPLSGSRVILREIGGTLGRLRLGDDEWTTLRSSPVYSVRIDDHTATHEWTATKADGTVTHHAAEISTSPVLVPPNVLNSGPDLVGLGYSWGERTSALVGRPTHVVDRRRARPRTHVALCPGGPVPRRVGRPLWEIGTERVADKSTNSVLVTTSNSPEKREALILTRPAHRRLTRCVHSSRPSTPATKAHMGGFAKSACDPETLTTQGGN